VRTARTRRTREPVRVAYDRAVRRGERVASRFEVLHVAGRGGMGTVFRARDHRDRRDVALKVLAARSVDGIARFQREAAILAQIHHPNVVEYVAHGVVPDGPCWLVMEWVDGETLADRLDGAGLDARETVVVAAQVARALGALHVTGVVHRDVKPSNLMLIGGDVGRVKLVDFGVARRTVELARLTRTGVTVGTAGYMSPEQARGEPELDARVDLFALGCVMHECLTGAPAFRGGSTLACRAKVLLTTPPHVRKLAPALPPALDALVASLLARRADERPADAAALERALAALGEVPRVKPARAPAHARDTATYTPPSQDLSLAGVLVAGGDTEAIARAVAGVHGATLEPFDGGVAITIQGPVGAAARLALAIAAVAPDALIAVAAGESPDEIIDRGARVLDEVMVAAEARGEAARGAWIDPAAARGAPELVVEHDGGRVRLVGQGP
jgi:hypothetical protein